MKIFISEIDRQSARSIALKNIARFFAITNWEFMTNDDLLKSISELRNPNKGTLVKLLENYFKAYDEWFDFYQKKKSIEKQRKEEYTLNLTDKNELQILIAKREGALGELEAEFNRLQNKDINSEQPFLELEKKESKGITLNLGGMTFEGI